MEFATHPLIYLIFMMLGIASAVLIVLRVLFVADTHFLVLRHIWSKRDWPDLIREGEAQAYKRNQMTWKSALDFSKWRITDFYPEYQREQR